MSFDDSHRAYTCEIEKPKSKRKASGGGKSKSKSNGKSSFAIVNHYQQVLAFALAQQMVQVVRNNGFFVPVNLSMKKVSPRLFSLLAGVHVDQTTIKGRSCHFPNHIYCNISNVMAILQFLLMYSYYYKGKVPDKYFLRLDNEILENYIHDFSLRKQMSPDDFDGQFWPNSDSNPAEAHLNICYKVGKFFFEVNDDKNQGGCEAYSGHPVWNDRFTKCSQSHSVSDFINILCSGGYDDLNQAKSNAECKSSFLPIWKSAEVAIVECDFGSSDIQFLRNQKIKNLSPPKLGANRPQSESSGLATKEGKAVEVNAYFSRNEVPKQWFANNNINLPDHMANFLGTASVKAFRATLHTAFLSCLADGKLSKEFKYDQDLACKNYRSKKRIEAGNSEGVALLQLGNKLFSSQKPTFEKYIIQAFKEASNEEKEDGDVDQLFCKAVELYKEDLDKQP